MDGRSGSNAGRPSSFSRIPERGYQHGNGDDWHETIDAFDSLVKHMGDARQDFYGRDVTEAEKRKWKREDVEREKRRRPPGFASW